MIIDGYNYNGHVDSSVYLTFETLEDGYAVKCDVSGSEVWAGHQTDVDVDDADKENLSYNIKINIVVKANVEKDKTEVYSISSSFLYVIESDRSTAVTQALICEYSIDFTTNKLAGIQVLTYEQSETNGTKLQSRIEKIDNGTLTIGDVKYEDGSSSKFYTEGIDMYVGEYDTTAKNIIFNGYKCLMYGNNDASVSEDVLNTMLSGALSKLTGKISVRTQNIDTANAIFLNNIIGESYLYGYNKTYMYNYNYLFKELDEEIAIMNSVDAKLNAEGVEVDQKYKDMVDAIKVALSEKTDKTFNGMNKFSGQVANKSFYVKTSAFGVDEDGKNVLQYEIASSEESTELLCVEVKIATNELYKISINENKTITTIYTKA